MRKIVVYQRGDIGGVISKMTEVASSYLLSSYSDFYIDMNNNHRISYVKNSKLIDEEIINLIDDCLTLHSDADYQTKQNKYNPNEEDIMQAFIKMDRLALSDLETIRKDQIQEYIKMKIELGFFPFSNECLVESLDNILDIIESGRLKLIDESHPVIVDGRPKLATEYSKKRALSFTKEDIKLTLHRMITTGLIEYHIAANINDIVANINTIRVSTKDIWFPEKREHRLRFEQVIVYTKYALLLNDLPEHFFKAVIHEIPNLIGSIVNPPVSVKIIDNTPVSIIRIPKDIIRTDKLLESIRSIIEYSGIIPERIIEIIKRQIDANRLDKKHLDNYDDNRIVKTEEVYLHERAKINSYINNEQDKLRVEQIIEYINTYLGWSGDDITNHHFERLWQDIANSIVSGAFECSSLPVIFDNH